MSLKGATKNKLSIQFSTLGKNTQIMSKRLLKFSNLILLHHPILKNNCFLGIAKTNFKEIYSHNISLKDNIVTNPKQHQHLELILKKHVS